MTELERRKEWFREKMAFDFKDIYHKNANVDKDDTDDLLSSAFARLRRL